MGRLGQFPASEPVHQCRSRRRARSVATRCRPDLGLPRSTPGCVPINLFGPAGTVTQAMLDSISADHYRDITADLRSFVGNISGTLFALPAGDLNVALGGEYRERASRSIRTMRPIIRPGRRTSCRRSARCPEVYAEIGIPVLKDVPLIYRLDIEAARRFSHYNAFGDTWNPKVGVKWRPYRTC